METTPLRGSAAKRLHVLSTARGCLTNLQETTNVRKSLLSSSPYVSSDRPEDADVIIVNTCGYNDTAEAASVGAILELKRKYPEKKIIVGGCLPKINPGKLQAIHGGQGVVPSGEWDKLSSLLSAPDLKINRVAGEATALEREDLDARLPGNRLGEKASKLLFSTEQLLGREFQPAHNILSSLAFDSQTYVISVGTGCLGHCTYCAIKNAKGRLVSRPLATILAELKAGLVSGFRRFHLVGDDIGCWGQDIGTSSAALLREILKFREEFEIVVNYFDPTWLLRLFDFLREPLSDPRVICVNFPIQSGSTRLVRQMARYYDVETVLERIARIKSANPTLVSKTHLMVGFPGETREDFRKTLDAVRHFDLIFPNRFAPRIGTPAARSKEQIPERRKRYRFLRLKASVLARHSQVAAGSIFRGRRAAQPCEPLLLQ